MNDVTLIGNIGNDPELKTFDSGTQLCIASMATNKVYKDKNGEKQTDTQWHNLSIFRNATTFERIVSKGDLIAIKGEIKTRKYQDNQGATKYKTEIIVNEFEKLSSKNDSSNSNSSNLVNAQNDDDFPPF